MTSQWYISHAGKTLGPISAAKLKQLATEGKIHPQTSVRLGPEGVWVPAGRVQRLFDAPASNPQLQRNPSAATNPAVASTPPVAPPPIAPPPIPPPAVAAPPNATLTPLQVRADETSRSACWILTRWLGLAGLFVGVVAIATFLIPILSLCLAAMGVFLGMSGLLAFILGRSAFSPIARWVCLAVFLAPAIPFPVFSIVIMGMGLGVPGVVLGMGGVLACGIAAAALRRSAGVGFAIAGTVASVIAVGSASTAWYLGSHGISPRTQANTQVAAQVQPQPQRPQPAPAAPPSEPAPAPEIIWTDASQPAEFGDLRVRVVSVGINEVRLDDTLSLAIEGRSRRKKEKVLQVRLSFENISASKKMDYVGFASGSLLGQGAGALLGAGAQQAIASAAPALADNLGNSYQQQMVNASGTDLLGGLQPRSMYPGKSLEDTLTFQPPVPQLEYLRLELPGAGIGHEGTVRFQIPAKMVQGLEAK